VLVSVDEVVGIDALERAALEFARSAPGELIASAVDAMVAELFTEVCGPFGFPIDDDAQIVAPWACPGRASKRGFRRRGAQARRRKLTSLVGKVALRCAMVECRSCSRRFSPLGQLLGLAPRQRRSPEVSKATAALAVEVAYAKAARLIAEVGGVEVSARTIRRSAGVSRGLCKRVGPGVGLGGGEPAGEVDLEGVECGGPAVGAGAGVAASGGG
jgi:hypothetical protein